MGDLLTLDVQGTSRPWYTACLYCQVLLALTATFGGPGTAVGGCACSVEGFQEEPYEQPNLLPTSGSRKVLQHCRGLGEELEREGGGIPLDVSTAPSSLAFDFQPIVSSLSSQPCGRCFPQNLGRWNCTEKCVSQYSSYSGLAHTNLPCFRLAMDRIINAHRIRTCLLAFLISFSSCIFSQ